MNRPLMKLDIKSNWFFFIVIMAIMLMYMSVISMMYDPTSMEAMNNLLAAMPKQLISAMGFDDLGSTLTDFMASYYYGFIILMFPMIYCIVTSGRLVSRYVDRGSMAYLLSCPVRRPRIAATQALFFVLSLLLLFGVVALGGYAFCEAGFPGMLELDKYWRLNCNAFFLFMAISGICFLCSCSFDDAKVSSALGSGIPIGFYVIHMLSNVGDKLAWLKKLTIFSLYDTEAIMGGSPTWAQVAALLAIAAAAYIAGVAMFSRRDMAL